MSENTNTFITGEVYPYQITDRTLSFIPKLSPAADDHFKELVTGKIKISLYDFSNGKGDNGIYTYFNLDLKQFRYIYERAKLSHLPAPYESSKIHCQSVETDGPFKGYCKSFRFYLARNATYIDKKTGETCTMRAPWYLKITNGYAIPGKDGKGEQRNSFKQTSSAYINLSDEDFLDRMESIHIYIKEYTHIVAQNSLAANLKKLDDIYKRGEYDPNLPSEAHSSTQQQTTPADPWYLKITNGYAIPGKDGKGEQRNSFKQTSSAYINLSDEDFLDRMESIHIYIKEYTHIVAQNSLAANLKKLDDIYKRGEYDPNLPSEAHSSTQQQTTPADPNVPQQAATTNSQPTQSNPVLPDMPELHTMELKITSNFQAMENSYVVKCEIDGRVYLLYCNNPVPKELIEAQKSGATITARLYSKDKTMWYYDLAS